jgi:multiple sugar transport system ATP-binding protein
VPTNAVTPAAVERDVILGIRPEHLDDAGVSATDGRPTLTVPVTLTETVGSEVIVHAELGRPLTARVSPQTNAAAGGTVTLAVDPERLYVFDPETGLAL